MLWGNETQEERDLYFMKEAFKQAEIALSENEIPVGALVVWKDKILSRAHNLTETLTDVTAHAEMQAITAACNAIGGKYLNECTLYVTLEPCVMCAGALYWAQIGRVVYGADDPKRGCSRAGTSLFHPKTTIQGGVLKEESAAILSDFFKQRR